MAVETASTRYYHTRSRSMHARPPVGWRRHRSAGHTPGARPPPSKAPPRPAQPRWEVVSSPPSGPKRPPGRACILLSRSDLDRCLAGQQLVHDRSRPESLHLASFRRSMSPVDTRTAPTNTPGWRANHRRRPPMVDTKTTMTARTPKTTRRHPGHDEQHRADPSAQAPTTTKDLLQPESSVVETYHDAIMGRHRRGPQDVAQTRSG